MTKLATHNNVSYVSDSLKTLDKDRYYASLVVPEKPRAAVQALWAMSAEIAAIRERVREPAPGEIRLQWWVDALAGEGHGNVRQNPLADAVLDAVTDFSLPTGPIVRLFAARRFDLYQDPMPDTSTFEGYAGETHSVLFQYASIILNDGNPVENGDAAGHLGVAQAYLGHLAAFGFNAARGQIFLPMDIFAAHAVSDKEILLGKPDERICAACAQILELAEGHIQAAQSALTTVPKVTLPAFAHIALLKRQAKALKKRRAEPFSPVTSGADWQKLGALALWMMRNN